MNLNERAILVSLKIGLPTATKRDKQATEDVERVHHSQNLGRFNKDLVNKSFFAKIKSIESQARQYLYTNTVPWGDDDSRLLSMRRFAVFGAKMQEFGAQFDAEADGVVAQWPMILQEAEKRLGAKLFNPAEYPDESLVRDRFRFRVGYTPVPTGDDLRVSLDAEQLDEMRARIDEDAQAALKASMLVPWERLHTAVAHMAQSLAKPEGRVYESVVGNLAELCDVLPDLNLVDDAKLDKAVALVKAQLLLPVDRLRDDPAVKQNTAAAAQKIANAMASWMKK